MPFILPGNVGSATAATGFSVDNSCMFNSADSASLSKTPSSDGSNTVWTVSMWVKRASLASGKLHAAGTSDTYEFLFDDSNFGLTLYNGDAKIFETTRALRDISAWYSIVLAYNTGLSGTNKVKLFINGVQETSFSTDNRSSAGTMNHINQDIVQYVGRTHGGGLFDGYMAEVCIIDGTAYAASDFGEFDGDSGIWKPIDVSGLTFGSRGFYLDFKDSGNLGDDESGNENDFTESGIAATDQGIDTCTNNFATLNPLIQGTSNNARTFSEGNTTVVLGRDSASVSSIGVSAGKWYVEIKCITDAANPVIFIAEEGSPATVNPYGGTNGVGVKEFGYVNDGKKKGNAGDFTSYGATWTAGNIISMAYDADNGTLWFAKNGAWQASATKTEIENGTTTNAAFTGLSGLFFFGCCDAATGTGDKFSCNFGSPYFAISSGNADGDGFGNFEYEVPSGYFALCTKNLAEYGG